VSSQLNNSQRRVLRACFGRKTRRWEKHLAARRGSPTRHPLQKVLRPDLLFRGMMRMRASGARAPPEISPNEWFASVPWGLRGQRDGQFTQTTTAAVRAVGGLGRVRMGIIPGPPSRGLQPGHPRARWTCPGGRGGKRVRLNAGTM